MKKSLLKKAEEVLEGRKLDILSKNIIKDVDIDIEGDETDEIQGKNIALIHNQILHRDKERLQRIERALNKLKNGTFGDCEECEEPIEEKRLLANPEFGICISCASLNELREKRSRGIH
jgi:DnaK suppressor protein